MSQPIWKSDREESPSPFFIQFTDSLAFDRELVDVDIRGSQAFARSLHRVGILSGGECEAILQAFEELRTEARDPEFYAGANDEDIHSLVIRKLHAKVGDAIGGKIHTGRSRNEQVSLDVRLWLREAIDLVKTDVRSLLGALLPLAERYPDAMVPGYTHLRRGQPVLWAHYILAYFDMFARDHERLTQARARVNVMPLGSGALAGSGFPHDREAIARELGFDALTTNSMDVSADRDFLLDFLHAANTIALHLSRLAEDWILYSSEEFAWMELRGGVTSGSSLMPQKRNPDSLELIRGKAGRVIGAYTALVVTIKGLPMTYNRDLQEDKEPLFDAVRQVRACLRMAREVAAGVVLDPAIPAQAVRDSWVVATDLAEALSRSGVPFRDSHHLVRGLVLDSLTHGKLPRDWNAESLAARDARFTPEIARLLDPREGMRTREILGGTGPESVAAALKRAVERLAAMNGE